MRVVIAEDQVLLREGLARLFADGGHQVVVDSSGDARDRWPTVVDRTKPGPGRLDIRMPPTYHRRRSPRGARDQGPRIPRSGCCVLSQHIETTHAVDLVGRRASATC